MKSMILQSLNILNYRNIREASLEFAPKLNCFVGLNGQGKTNVLPFISSLSPNPLSPPRTRSISPTVNKCPWYKERIKPLVIPL